MKPLPVREAQIEIEVKNKWSSLEAGMHEGSETKSSKPIIKKMLSRNKVRVDEGEPGGRTGWVPPSSKRLETNVIKTKTSRVISSSSLGEKMISKVETDLPQGPRGAYSSWSLRQAIYCIEPIGTKGAVLAGNKTHKRDIKKDQ